MTASIKVFASDSEAESLEDKCDRLVALLTLEVSEMRSYYVKHSDRMSYGQAARFAKKLLELTRLVRVIKDDSLKPLIPERKLEPAGLKREQYRFLKPG